MDKTLEQLEAEMAPIRAAMLKLRDAEALKDAKALVGRCFKYRNCYSLPKSDADYWWLYVKVIGVGGTSPKSFQFQIDKDGRIEIETCRYHSHLSNYVEIKPREFDRAWRAAQKRIAGMKP